MDEFLPGVVLLTAFFCYSLAILYEMPTLIRVVRKEWDHLDVERSLIDDVTSKDDNSI